MRFAVEEINNSSTLLPGLSLGYEIFDVCYLTNIIQPLFYFLSDDQLRVEVKRDYSDSKTRVVAVIGPDAPSTAVTAAYLLSQFLVPQITYSATTEALSSPKTFPVAFRTIPSTEQQITLLLNLMKYFRWNWVIVLSSEDEYGQQNAQLLRSKIGTTYSEVSWICVAFQETIPVQKDNQQEPDGATLQRFQLIITKIKGNSAKVVIVLSTELSLLPFFREVINQNLTGLVWVASEAWATDLSIFSMHNISSIGSVFGVAVQDVPIPGLDEFRIKSPKVREAAPPMCNQECDDCLLITRRYDASIRAAGNRIDFNVYSSVYVVAHALHALLGCNKTGCSKQTFYPWQLLREVGRVNFTLLNNVIQFDEKGDPPNGFEIVQWQWDIPGKPFRRVAKYKSPQEELLVYMENIIWHTENSTPPRSVCSAQCGQGQRRKVLGSSACCFICVECEAGTFLNKSDIFTCQNCPHNTWSNPGQEECFAKTVVFFSWHDPASPALLSSAFLGLLATLGILLTFIRHHDTPVVRSAGGRLCFLMLAALATGFCSVAFYIGEPTELKCIGRRSAFGLCFSLCIACITVRSFQIICVFKVAARLPRAYDLWRKYHGQEVFVATIFALKIIIMGCNVYFYPPVPALTAVRHNPAVLLLMCSPDYRASMVLSNTLEMFLCFLCFSFAYMGKAMPKNYNEAKYVTLSMTGYFSCWATLFLVMTLYDGVMVNKVDTTIMLTNLFNICLGYFGPKCYVIFFRPERNTAAFFQTAIQSYTMRQD
nr:taste receptor type 1 member 2 [Anolis sagrei ordinatus]